MHSAAAGRVRQAQTAGGAVYSHGRTAPTMYGEMDAIGASACTTMPAAAAAAAAAAATGASAPRSSACGSDIAATPQLRRQPRRKARLAPRGARSPWSAVGEAWRLGGSNRPRPRLLESTQTFIAM